jgi:uncharacterized membrane protein YgcG
MRLCIVLLSLLLQKSASISSYSPSDLANPLLNPAACGRPGVSKSVICDPSNLLEKESKDVIEGYINAITGAQLAVVVIDEMSYNFKGSEDIEVASERFARTLHNTWGVGDKATDNGILLFLSIKDRAVFISTGAGVQSKITKRYIDYLITLMKPDLRSRQYGSALEKTVVEIDLILSGKSNISSQYKRRPSDSGDGGDPYLFWGFVILVGGVASFIAYRENRKLRNLEKGKKALEDLMKEVVEAGENKDFLSESCPVMIICVVKEPAYRSCFFVYFKYQHIQS